MKWSDLALPGVVAWPYIPIIKWIVSHQIALDSLGWGILVAAIYAIIMFAVIRYIRSTREP